MSETTNSAPIVELWQQSTEEKEQTQLGLSLDSLRVDADAAFLKARRKKISATQNLVAAKEQARTRSEGAFNRIVESRIALKEAELELATAKEIYTELFGEDPRSSE